MHIEVMDKTARGTKVIFSIKSVKYVMMKNDKLHAQETVSTFNNIGSNANGESIIFLVKNGVESLPDEVSLS